MSGLAGKNLRFDMGAGPTHMKVDRGSCNLATQLIESTNSESAGGASEFVFGVNDGDVDIDVVYQETDTPYASMGDGVSGNGTFYPDKGQTGNKVTGTLMIGTFQITGEVRGLVKAHITGKYSGGRTVTSL
jgi:hypothetical protein